MKKIVLFLSLILISGCSAFDKKNTAPPEIKVPKNYNFESNGKREINKWWEEFNSPELNTLVEKGLKNNHSIKKSFASLKKAEALARKTGANLSPDINLKGDSSISQTHSKDSTRETKSTSLGLAASYEIDLWGQIKSQKEAAFLSSKASSKDLEAASITIASKIVNTWKDLVSNKIKLNLQKKIENENKNQLELLKLRFKNGMVNASDIYDQEKDLLNITSQINLIESEIKILKNSLAFLTGESRISDLNEVKLPELKEIPETGIPADLIESRPDVNAAKLRLLSSQLNLYSAKKDLLPKLSLSGSVSITSDDFSLSLDDWISSLAANLTAPIFNGGSLKEEVKRSKAERDEYLYSYASAIFSSINEVQDAIAREEHQNINILILKKRIESAKKALFYARNEYLSGNSDYISVIERYNALKNLEILLVNEETNLIEYRVSLYRSIGNNWTDNFVKELKEK
jgi:NodT family efflux transporter outer membrane factor (OMF) lipoprotein